MCCRSRIFAGAVVVVATVVVVAVSAVALAVVDVAGVRPRVPAMISRSMAFSGLALRFLLRFAIRHGFGLSRVVGDDGVEAAPSTPFGYRSSLA